ARITRVANVLDNARQARRYTSTQEQNWMVLAAQALQKEVESFSLSVDGQERRGAYYRNIGQAALEAKPVILRNNGQAPARVVLSVSGIPTTPAPALSEGFTVKRTIHTLDGEEVQPEDIQQNERYAVRLEVTRSSRVGARLLVVDPLPAGLEIENARLTEGSTEGLDFLKSDQTPDHTEARDDRFVASVTLGDGGGVAPFITGYLVRAVTPGTYVHPAAIAEDMYRPERFGRTAFGTLSVKPAKRN
ncbi:MAG: alpha-2-macroglobulin family protein, partial [Beijerinckiaceae bacterium]|nr:alpha-2-macroglobulin family protein [Beijerinckiaceae bacterium]